MLSFVLFIMYWWFGWWYECVVKCAGVRCCFYYSFIMLVAWLFGMLLYLMLVWVRGLLLWVWLLCVPSACSSVRCFMIYSLYVVVMYAVLFYLSLCSNVGRYLSYWWWDFMFILCCVG